MVDDGVKAALAAMRARWNEGAARDADPGDRFASFCDVPKLLAVAEAVEQWRGAVCERDEFLFKHPSPDRWADETRAAYYALDAAVDEHEDALCATLAALGEP